jgi:hypothetical protein
MKSFVIFCAICGADLSARMKVKTQEQHGRKSSPPALRWSKSFRKNGVWLTPRPQGGEKKPLDHAI